MTRGRGRVGEVRLWLEEAIGCVLGICSIRHLRVVSGPWYWPICAVICTFYISMHHCLCTRCKPTSSEQDTWWSMGLSGETGNNKETVEASYLCKSICNVRQDVDFILVSSTTIKSIDLELRG